MGKVYRFLPILTGFRYVQGGGQWRCCVLAFLPLGLGARRGFGIGLIEQGYKMIAQALIRGSGMGFLGTTGNDVGQGVIGDIHPDAAGGAATF